MSNNRDTFSILQLKNSNDLERPTYFISVAYTADEVEYRWLEGNSIVVGA